MTLTNREKKLILFLAIFGILVLFVYYFYLPLVDELEEQKSVLEQNKAELRIVEGSVLSVKEQKAIIASLKAKLDFLSRVLPPVIYQESVISSLMDLTDKHDLLIRSYTFPDFPTHPEKDKSKESLEIILNNYDDSILGNISKSMITKRAEEINGQGNDNQDENQNENSSKNGDGTKNWKDVVKSINVELAVEGSYSDFKEAMTELETTNNLVIIKSYNFSKDLSSKSDKVIGNISLMFPYYYDNENLDDIFWNYKSKFELHNPFIYNDSWKDLFYQTREVVSKMRNESKLSRVEYNKNSSVQTQSQSDIEPDFYVVLNAPSSIQPRYLIGRTGAREMTLASSKKDENLVLTIEKTESGYGFRYKNSLQVFPSPAELYPFTPKYKDKIFVNVQSSPRVDNVDVGIARIQIVNKTGKQIYLVMRAEDKGRPRLILEGSGSSVKMVNK